MSEGLDKQKVLLSSVSERSSATNWNGSVSEELIELRAASTMCELVYVGVKFISRENAKCGSALKRPYGV